MTTLLCRLSQEEHRNVTGRPRKWQLLDFMGIAYGAFFMFDAAKPGTVPRWAKAAVAGTMIYIHSERFFYAPQTKRDLI